VAPVVIATGAEKLTCLPAARRFRWQNVVVASKVAIGAPEVGDVGPSVAQAPYRIEGR